MMLNQKVDQSRDKICRVKRPFNPIVYTLEGGSGLFFNGEDT
jgi:hypothetical protein